MKRMNTTTKARRGGKGAMVLLAATLLAVSLVSGCKSEARVNCEKGADAVGADKAPCKDL